MKSSKITIEIAASYRQLQRAAIAATVAMTTLAQTYQAEAKPQRPCHKKTTKKTVKGNDKVTTWHEPVVILKPRKRSR